MLGVEGRAEPGPVLLQDERVIHVPSRRVESAAHRGLAPCRRGLGWGPWGRYSMRDAVRTHLNARYGARKGEFAAVQVVREALPEAAESLRPADTFI